MASNYPGSLDSFDTIASDKKTSDAVGGRTHRQMHNDLGDAIEAVQTELGTDPAGASATVKARFEVIEANDWVTSARIAANAVGSSELADNAVDTAAVADSAITTAKVAAGAVTYDKLARQPGNLLTENQATGGAALGTTAGFTDAGSACTTTVESDGIRMEKTNTSSLVPFVMVGAYAEAATRSGSGGTIPVTEGDTYTFAVDVSSDMGTPEATKITIYFYAANQTTVIGSLVTSDEFTPTASAVRHEITTVAPTGAYYANVSVNRSASTAATGYAITVNRLSFHKGASGSYAPPGEPIVHAGMRPNPSNTAEVQIWNDATAAWVTVG